jgi:hypothetical protein
VKVGVAWINGDKVDSKVYLDDMLADGLYLRFNLDDFEDIPEGEQDPTDSPGLRFRGAAAARLSAWGSFGSPPLFLGEGNERIGQRTKGSGY